MGGGGVNGDRLPFSAVDWISLVVSHCNSLETEATRETGCEERMTYATGAAAAAVAIAGAGAGGAGAEGDYSLSAKVSGHS